MKKLILTLSIFTLSLTATATEKVVYGDDDRVDVYASTNALFVELAESTAAMIGTSSVRISGQDARINAGSLQSRGMCSTERFAKQPSAANCSGFLVGEDLLVTAGHCIRSMSSCRSYNWVFDYKVDYEDQANVTVPASSVYKCVEIVGRELNRSNKDDWALIRLDRKVTDRRILNFRQSGKPARGDNLVVIGHPSGLPTKIADGANVRRLYGTYFTANLDTYGGNSGSAVFNADTGVVEGILVRGAQDYVNTGGCRATNYLPNNGGRGEDVTFIGQVAPLYNPIAK
jgi:V8-like Glu-specific endopeptidase